VDSITYPVAFNGKTRFTIELPADISKNEIEKLALNEEKTKKYLQGKNIIKIIVVPKRMINIVIK
jgi:leucyl-tRNA synthetase